MEESDRRESRKRLRRVESGERLSGRRQIRQREDSLMRAALPLFFTAQTPHHSRIRKTVAKMHAKPTSSAAEKLECSQKAERKAAVRGSRQESREAFIGPAMRMPWRNRENAPTVPRRTMADKSTSA